MIVLRLNMQGEDTIEHTYGKCHEMKLILESKKLMRLKIHHDGFTLVHSLEWWSVVQLKRKHGESDPFTKQLLHG